MSIYNTLESKGILAFDISQIDPKEPESSWWINRKESGTEELVRTIFSRRNPETNVASVNLFFDIYQNGILKKRYYEHGEARLSAKKDIEKMLRNVGFKLFRVYGNFDKSSYSAQSPRVIFISSKP